MKIFNIRTVVLALFVGGLILTSCEDEAASTNHSNPSTVSDKVTNTSTNQGEDVSVSPINTAELDSMKISLNILRSK